MLRRAAVVCAFGVLLACKQPGVGGPTAVGDPVSATAKTPSTALIVSMPAKQALASGEIWFVDDGASALSTGVRKPGPALVVSFVDDSTPVRYNRLFRLAYHNHSTRYGEAFPVDPVDLDDIGIPVPTVERVWVFTTKGPCAARLGTGWVGRPSQSVRRFEISYALEGCGDRVAPFASTAQLMPDGLRWVEASFSDDAQFGLEEAWSHPLDAFAIAPEHDPDEEAVGYVAHARWVEGVEPRPAQALMTAITQDACGPEEHRATSGWWEGETFEPWDVPWLDPRDPPLLVGALAWGTQTAALAFDDGLDGLVAIVPAPEPPPPEGGAFPTEPEGPTEWTVHTLIRGVWTVEDRASARLRVQPGCASFGQ